MAVLAEKLAHAAHDVSFDDLAPKVTHEVKRRVLDSLGCALGAWSSRPARVTRKIAQAVSVDRKSVV